MHPHDNVYMQAKHVIGKPSYDRFYISVNAYILPRHVTCFCGIWYWRGEPLGEYLVVKSCLFME